VTSATGTGGLEKQLFDIDAVMAAVEVAVKDMPPPSMFQLRAEGFTSPFEQLVACIISIRSLEETSLPVSRELFAVARTPKAIRDLPVERIEELIHRSTFADRKARQIQEIARIVADRYDGELPCDAVLMQSFAGVGPKCANLAVGVACDQPTIPVDIHVHRVTNRWGYVHTKTPEQTLVALEAILPMAYRPGINRVLVPFGKYHCTGVRPKCSSCPVLSMCRQVGVTAHR
jgi:endonuclease-3